MKGSMTEFTDQAGGVLCMCVKPGQCRSAFPFKCLQRGQCVRVCVCARLGSKGQQHHQNPEIIVLEFLIFFLKGGKKGGLFDMTLVFKVQTKHEICGRVQLAEWHLK